MKKIIKTLNAVYSKVETAYIVAASMIIGALTLYTIIVRFFGIQSFPWLDELGRMMLITVTMIGCSMAVSSESHMAVDILYNLLGKKVTCILKAITNLLSGAFYIFLTKYTYDFTVMQVKLHRTMETIKWPLAIVWGIITLAVVTMALRHLAVAFSYVMRIIKNDMPEDVDITAEYQEGGNKE